MDNIQNSIERERMIDGRRQRTEKTERGNRWAGGGACVMGRVRGGQYGGTGSDGGCLE